MRALFVAGGYILYIGKWKEMAVVTIITKPSLRETAQHHTMCKHIACAHTYTHTSYNSFFLYLISTISSHISSILFQVNKWIMRNSNKTQ